MSDTRVINCLKPFNSEDPEKKQRRKIQNRLNQRARRSRMNDDVASKPRITQGKPTFGVKLWRLDEFDLKAGSRSGYKDESKTTVIKQAPWMYFTNIYRGILSCEDVELYSQQINIRRQFACLSYPASPLADQLLHLVHYNAFRAVFYNKATLSRVAEHIAVAPDGSTEKLNIMAGLKKLAIIASSAPDTPPHLQPTALQSTKAHATWIDLLPCSRMRDNLIVCHDKFNHWMLVNDVMGNLMQDVMFYKYGEGTGPERQYCPVSTGEFPQHRQGMIIWGEPHQMANWELTPGFLDRWGWSVEGCHELMKATNYWRSLRGEKALKFNLQSTRKTS